jgi:hypothetical protein
LADDLGLSFDASRLKQTGKDLWQGLSPGSRLGITMAAPPIGAAGYLSADPAAVNPLAHPDVSAMRHGLKGNIAEGAKALRQSEAGAAALATSQQSMAAQRAMAETEAAGLRDELVATGGRSTVLPTIDRAPSIFQRIGEGIGSGAQAGGMREQLSNYLMDPENRTKLMLGTGAGALGIGGLAAYLATRKKKNEGEE